MSHIHNVLGYLIGHNPSFGQEPGCLPKYESAHGVVRKKNHGCWSLLRRRKLIAKVAGIAQLVEQLLRKQLVGGSSPLSGTNYTAIKA